MELSRNDMCFGCGKKNECGLKLSFDSKDGKAVSEVIFKEHHQGWAGIVHGGVIASALDEAMAYALGSLGVESGVTASLSVRFKKPVRIGEPYHLEAEVVEFEGRKARIKAFIERNGVVHAEGEGIYVIVKEVKI